MSDIQQDLGKTVAIVRTYNFAGIGGFVLRLLSYGIRHVVVVVPRDQDNGVTRPILDVFKSPWLHLVEESFENGGRAWSAMLNTGLRYVKTVIDDVDSIDYVLPVSNTVQLEASQLLALYSALQSRSNIMVAGARFKGIGKDGEEVSLGASYNHHFRNTLALYHADAFRIREALEWFDESFDGQGGMEDLAWKLMLEGLTNFCVVENVVEVPLLVHTHRTPEQQAEYEALMERGIQDAKFRAEHLLFLDR